VPDLPVVLVEWLAPVPPPGTSEAAEPQEGPLRPRVCRTVGYLVGEIADTLLVAQSLIPADAEVDLAAAGDTVEIPRFLVQRLLTILPKWFDGLTEAEQTEWLGLMNAELLDLRNGQ
jgi:hypothetical protein